MSNGYYKTEVSVKEYIKLAKDVNGAELIEKLKPFLSLNSSILEIGSGPGSDWEILKRRNNKVVGSDNSKEFLNHLTSKFPNGEFLNLDAVSLNTNLKFDCIYSNKVMHHLTDEELVKSIKKQSDILNAEGIICHSFWKGEGSEIFKGLFVNYHEKEDLFKFYDPSFEILFLDFYTEFDKEDSILLIGKKK
ncbi:trans-aconitate 2-methyltransferase [uncultured Algibacter sp.]|uniref:class I SAM-dependent methyltransferase n=1 Tax=uncultured Algibacter sp. TaxID=298659 RepID=UPI002621C24D|nr:class I SAM-dependent methyltransferase [uncultured Algibacter sp.]